MAPAPAAAAAPAAPVAVVPAADTPPWHYVYGGQAQGPVDETELRAMFAAGQLAPETLVWNPTLSDWIAAGPAGLLPAPAPAPAPAMPAANTCPRCQAAVDPGARFCGHCGAGLG